MYCVPSTYNIKILFIYCYIVIIFIIIIIVKVSCPVDYVTLRSSVELPNEYIIYVYDINYVFRLLVALFPNNNFSVELFKSPFLIVL